MLPVACYCFFIVPPIVMRISGLRGQIPVKGKTISALMHTSG